MKEKSGANFFLGKLRILPAGGDAENTAGRGDLDDIDAVLVSLPDRPERILRSVNDSILRCWIIDQVDTQTVGWVRMATGGGEASTGRENAWSLDQSTIDRVA